MRAHRLRRLLLLIAVAFWRVATVPADSDPAVLCPPPTELHDNHPIAWVQIAEDELAPSAEGRLDLRFSVGGVVPGFRYKVVAEAVQVQLWQTDLNFHVDAPSTTYDGVVALPLQSREATTCHVRIGVYDRCEQVPPSEALVARRDVALSIVPSTVLHPPDVEAALHFRLPPLRAFQEATFDVNLWGLVETSKYHVCFEMWAEQDTARDNVSKYDIDVGPNYGPLVPMELELALPTGEPGDYLVRVSLVTRGLYGAGPAAGEAILCHQTQPITVEPTTADPPHAAAANGSSVCADSHYREFLEEDNWDLPIGVHGALVVTGLFVPGVTKEQALPSLLAHIVQPSASADGPRRGGGDGRRGESRGRGLQGGGWHVFVHSEAARNGIVTDEQVAHFFSAALGSDLKGIIVRQAGLARGPLQHPQAPQYIRLREAYEMVLSMERLRGSRYSHVARLRTDAIWLRRWPSVTELERQMPGAGFTVAGPMYPSVVRCLASSPRSRCEEQIKVNDMFFLASRAVARKCFVALPALFSRPSPRLTRCEREGRQHRDTRAERPSTRFASAAWDRVPSQDGAPTVKEGSGRIDGPGMVGQGGEGEEGRGSMNEEVEEAEELHGTMKGEEEAEADEAEEAEEVEPTALERQKRCYSKLWPETLLSEFLCASIGKHNLLDSCQIIGNLTVNNGWKTPHYQPCQRHFDFSSEVYSVC